MTKPIMDPSTGKQKTDPRTGRPLFGLVRVVIEAVHTLMGQLAKELGGNLLRPLMELRGSNVK